VNGVQDQPVAHQAAIHETVDAVAVQRCTSGRDVKPLTVSDDFSFRASSSGSVMAARKAADAAGISDEFFRDCRPKKLIDTVGSFSAGGQ